MNKFLPFFLVIITTALTSCKKEAVSETAPESSTTAASTPRTTSTTTAPLTGGGTVTTPPTTGGGTTTPPTTGGGTTTPPTTGGGTTPTTPIVVVDTQYPVARMTSPLLGDVWYKNTSYTFRGSVSDDVALKQVTITVRKKTTDIYLLNKVITIPANTKTYTVNEALLTPNLSTTGFYTASIVAEDMAGKKTAMSVDVSVR
jgi:Domain of unknown function (DUF4625)